MVSRARATTRPATPTRPYSLEFPTTRDTPSAAYYLQPIPADLWARVRAKAARERISMRALILGLLRDWLEAE